MKLYICKDDNHIEIVCDEHVDPSSDLEAEHVSELTVQDVMSGIDAEVVNPFEPVCSYCGATVDIDELPQRLEVGEWAYWWEEPFSESGPCAPQVVSGKILKVFENGDVMIMDETWSHKEFRNMRRIKKGWLVPNGTHSG